MNKKSELTVKELELIMSDQWSEIERGIKIVDDKGFTFGGKEYGFKYIKEGEEVSDLIRNFEYSKKIELMIESYNKDIPIVELLIEDVQLWLDTLETNYMMHSLFKKDNINESEEDMFFSFNNMYHLESAKATIDYLVKLSEEKLLLGSEGLTNRYDEYENSIDELNKKDEIVIKNNKYNNHKNAMVNNFNENDKIKALNYFNNSCALTGVKDNIEMDHVIPISWRILGTSFNNMIPLNKSLNVSKGNRNIFKWYESNNEKYNIEESKFIEVINYIAKLNNMNYIQYKEFVYESEKNVIERKNEIDIEIKELKISKSKLDKEIFNLELERINL